MNCPVCGTQNPAGSKFCNNCGARLAADPAPEESPAAAGIPDWLADLEAETSSGSDEPAAGGAGQDNIGDGEPAEAVPAWLADIESSTEEGLDVETSDEQIEQPEETVPAWLADLEVEEPERGKPWERKEEIPSWLAEVEAGPEELESDLDEEADKWLADLDPEAEEEIGDFSLDTEDTFTGWLSERDEEAGDETPWMEKQDEMPADQFAESDEKTESRRTGVDRSAGRDEAWLPEAGVSEESSSEAEEPFAESRKTSLDWLADQPTDAGAELSPPASEGLFEEAEDLADPADWNTETIPDWLNELAGGTSEPEASPAPETAEDAELEVPLEGAPDRQETELDSPVEAEGAADWLADLQIQDTEATLDDEEMLEWLREEGEEESPEPTEAAAEMEESPAVEEAPDWLADLQTQDTEATVDDEEMLEWLAEQGEAESQHAAEAAAEPLESPVADEEPPSLPESRAEEEEEISDEVGEELDADEIPGWLAGTEAAGAEAAPPTTAEAPEADDPDEDDDDWLRALGEVEGDGDPLTAQATTSAEMPEWLRQMAPPETEAPAPEDEADTGVEDVDESLDDIDEPEEMPEWLNGMVAASEEFGSDDFDLDIGPEPEPVVEEEPFPDLWSDSDVADEESAETELETPHAEEPLPDEELSASPVPEDDLPDWLGDVMVDMDEPEPFMFEEETGREEPFFPAEAEVDRLAEEPAEDEYPDWLEEGQAEPTPVEDLPEWLRPPAGVEALPSPEDEEADYLPDELLSLDEADQEFSDVEIPEWIQSLRPDELEHPESEDVPDPAASEPLVTVGPLAGLRGVIEIEPVIAEARTAEFTVRDELSDEQHQQATLLRQVVRSAPQVTVPVAAEPASIGSPLLRALLSLLLLAAVLTGFFFPDLMDIPFRGAELDEAESLVTEAAPRPVLVAFDYTPAMAGALDAHTSLLLGTLAESGSPVLFVSQSAAGLALAEQKVASVSDLSSRRVGYLPGNATGLRRLAPCLQAEAACQTVFGAPLTEEVTVGLAESALLIVLAGDRESAINWIEQVAANTDKPMLAVVPPAVEPVIAPYYGSGQLAGLLSTSAPSVAPEQGGDVADEEGSRATATALAQWLVIGLLLVGNLVFLFRGSWPGTGLLSGSGSTKA